MPGVSVIVPCYNEEKTIGLLLSAILQQTFPLEEIEVVIADGMSTDGTLQAIEKIKFDHPELTILVIENPKRNIPAALNSAILASRREFIVRMDAHSKPEPTYIERSIQALLEGKGDNVGGVWQIEPGGPGAIARGIAAAASHPLGVGDAFYRFATKAGEVDTVPFGAFRRSLIEELGGFDETLLTNEDYEFNTRIRQHGGKIWLDPEIRSVYFARRTLKLLAKQYWRYGFWKMKMLRRYPSTLRWRQALPPIFLLSLLLLAFLASFWPLAAIGLVLEVVLYIGILIMASVSLAKKRKDGWFVLTIPAAIITMHICWGAGFWASLFDLILLMRKNEKKV